MVSTLLALVLSSRPELVVTRRIPDSALFQHLSEDIRGCGGRPNDNVHHPATLLQGRDVHLNLSTNHLCTVSMEFGMEETISEEQVYKLGH